MKKLILFFTLLCLFSCSNNNYISIKSTGTNYKVEYMIHWCAGLSPEHEIIYTNDSVYVCSFQGTNFLLEKNNSEELFSTTAPIQIRSIEKIH